MLASSNALVAASVMVSTVVVIVQMILAALDEDDVAFSRLRDDVDQLLTAPSATAYWSILLSAAPAVVSLVFSCLSNRRRGAVIGSAVLVLAVLETWSVLVVELLGPAVAFALAAGARVGALVLIVVVLVRPGRSIPASWPVFARRNRRTFVVSMVVLTTVTLVWVVVDATAVPAGTDVFSNPSPWVGWLILAGIVVGGGAGVVAVTALYLAGIRAVPLAVVATLASAPLGAAMMNVLQAAVIYGVAGALALGVCYRQFGKVNERPPMDFWETRWRAWTWPISIGAAVAFYLAILALPDRNDWNAALPGLAVAAAVFLLNVLRGLAVLIGRRLRARRLDAWIGARLG